MSRIGKLPIAVPSGVDVAIAEQLVTVKGPKGTLAHTVAAPSSAARARVRFQARSAKPAPARRAAICCPIRPSPMIATVVPA